jgi:hypothetical protein
MTVPLLTYSLIAPKVIPAIKRSLAHKKAMNTGINDKSDAAIMGPVTLPERSLMLAIPSGSVLIKVRINYLMVFIRVSQQNSD